MNNYKPGQLETTLAALLKLAENSTAVVEVTHPVAQTITTISAAPLPVGMIGKQLQPGPPWLSLPNQQQGTIQPKEIPSALADVVAPIQKLVNILQAAGVSVVSAPTAQQSTQPVTLPATLPSAFVPLMKTLQSAGFTIDLANSTNKHLKGLE